jgi:hypothetical protein
MPDPANQWKSTPNHKKSIETKAKSFKSMEIHAKS